MRKALRSSCRVDAKHPYLLIEVSRQMLQGQAWGMQGTLVLPHRWLAPHGGTLAGKGAWCSLPIPTPGAGHRPKGPSMGWLSEPSPRTPKPHGGIIPRAAAYLSNLGDHRSGIALLDYGEFATCHSGYSPIVISNSKGSVAPSWFTVPAG